MSSRSARVTALVGVCAIAGSAVAAGAAHATTSSPSSGWTVDTSNCSDPDRANAPIEGTVRIGSAMPLSGGPAAAAFAPAAQGFQSFVAYANAQGLLPGYTIDLTIGDDQYNPSLTPGVVQGIIDDGVDLFSGDIGTDENLAVRDTLNEACIPQLNLLTGDPAWGSEAEEYPWTTGLLMPYDTESRGYVASIQDNFPGAKIGLFYVDNGFGNVYADAFRDAADAAGLEIIEEQTIADGEDAPPTAQVAAIADAAPDVIMATPLGGQCPTFMTEIANQLAVRTDWHPAVYITNTCASPLILAVAGDHANGLYTSASMGLADIANPDVQTGNAAVAAYIAEMTNQGFGDIITTAAAGWNVGEVTLAVLQQAAESEGGLTQASIIEAARNLTFRPSLLRDNLHEYVMNGLDDTFYSEDVQVVQYDSSVGHFNDIGDPYRFETSAG
jgi:branched-chain amino acid transport system substrate-binding protein